MGNIITLVRKELNSYFRSPIAYLLLFLFAAATGSVFYLYIKTFIFQSLTQAQYAQMYEQQMPAMNVNEMVIRPVLGWTGSICLFLAPMITMRLFAEERKTGTIELLLTSPVTDLQLVLGKFFASMILYMTMLALTGLYFIVLFRYGNPDFMPLIPGYLGQLLLGGSFLSLGLMFSTMTRNQVVAGSLTFFCLILFMLVQWSGDYAGGIWSQVAGYVSWTAHLENFSKGVIDLKDTVYYLSVIVLGLFVSVRSLESIRWRA
jgi:ABC-2 type transport system permease protein